MVIRPVLGKTWWYTNVETLLSENIPSRIICLDGYILLRKDRSELRTGGGVVICRNDWKLKCFNIVHHLECIWCEIIIVNTVSAAVYHPSDPVYPDVEFVDHVSERCEQVLSLDPNGEIVIAGNINQLNIKDLISQHVLYQTVKREQRMVDVSVPN